MIWTLVIGVAAMGLGVLLLGVAFVADVVHRVKRFRWRNGL